MIIQTTGKLQSFLKTNGIPLPDAAEPFACWHGNIKTIKRRKAILLTHNISRYSILLYGVTQKDIPRLSYKIYNRLKEQMIYDGFSPIKIEELLYYSNAFSYYKSSDRNVLGTMNRMMKELPIHIEKMNEKDEKIISSYFNTGIYGPNPYLSPKEVLESIL